MGTSTAPKQVPPPEDLFHYEPTYAVLICKACQYAIQPSGLARHLKEIHQVYRSRRRPYMEYATHFKLAPAEDVIRAKVTEFPVRSLPVLDGLRCLHSEGCGYLCVSVKRMQSHWVCAHGRRGCVEDGEWGRAALQTFFRGNLLQYFTDSKVQDQPSPSDSITLAPQPKFNTLDWGLLHHYVTSTSLTLVDRHGTEDIWAVTIPQLASSSPFLMHAILACSALHLAHKLPSQRQLYLLSARTHQDAAMPLFRRAVAEVDQWNCQAVLVFSHLLVIYSFAADFHDDGDEQLLLAKPSSTETNMLCNWLYFIRNGCVAVCEYWDLIESGPLASLADSWESHIPGLQDSVAEPALTKHLLSVMPSTEGTQDEHIDRTWSDEVCEIYCDSATQLGWAFTAARSLAGNDFTTWDAVRLWPMEISTEYIGLLVQEHPAALILLAHYCLLLERLQPHWYFEDRATRLLNVILERLDSKWHDCIKTSLNKADSLL